MLAACFCFGTMGLMVKLASAQASLGEIVLFRGWVPGLMIACWALRTQRPLKSPVIHLHVRRNAAGLVAMWSGFFTTTVLPLATATTLMYTSPLFIALILWVLQKQHQNGLDKFSIALGFLGVMLVLQPVFEQGQLGYAMIGLASGFISAIAYLQVKSLGQAKEPEWRTVFYFALGATVTGGVFVAMDSNTPLLETWATHSTMTWIWLMGLGVFGGAGNLALTRAFGSGSTWLSASLQYLTILVSTAYGVLVLGDGLNAAGGMGALLIIACGGLSAYAAHKGRSKP